MSEKKIRIDVETEDEAIEIDGEGEEDLEGVLREAVAAVSEVEDGQRREPGEEEAADEEVENLRREIADLRDRSMRTLADFDNFRKRARREQEELKRYALLGPLRLFLDVVDNLERAVAADGTLEDLKAGVEMILRQMHDLLRQFGAQPVAADGEPFDPNLHEAVARVEDDSVDAPRVLDELQRGYRLHDRLLRPARVRVAVPAEEPAEAREAAAGREPA